MASLCLSNLSVCCGTCAALDQGYLYKDLCLGHDMNRVSYNNQLETKAEIKDVQGVFDLESIKNSILNIFSTSPGEKILSPRFGIDLRKFVFEPIATNDNFEIQFLIETELPPQEPRINLLQVIVVPDDINQQYVITLIYDVKSLHMYNVTQKALLNSSGYAIATE